MKFTVNVKPTLIKASSKEALLRKIGIKYTWSSKHAKYGNGIVFENDQSIRVYNMHKVNAKYEQIKHKRDNPEKQFVKGRTKQSKLVREKQWIAYVYNFKFGVLDALGIEVDQKARNFVIKKRK